ncbi:hypothetical protein ECTW09098_1534, partial [Escherichia coli TW09098]
MWPVPLLHGF